MTTEQPPTFREVGVEEAKRLRDAGYRVIDVRERVEWDEGHLPGATLIPLADVASASRPRFPIATRRCSCTVCRASGRHERRRR